MTDSSAPLVYLILGAPDSDRRLMLADFLDGGLEETDRALTFLPATEPPADIDARLGAVERWHWSEGRVETPDWGEATHVFFLVEGRANPIDQIEGFQTWLRARGGCLARILCVVNCQLASQHAALRTWYDACIHFADVVVLTKREGVENKWISDFQNRYKAQFYPCLFELLRQGRVKNPALLLDPAPRRLSQAFEEDPVWVGPEESESLDAEDDEEDGLPVVDPYLARGPSGRRNKEIPDIAAYLPA